MSGLPQGSLKRLKRVGVVTVLSAGILIIATWAFSSSMENDKGASGIRLIREGRSSEGQALLEEHLRGQPDDSRIRKHLIDHYRREGDSAAAESHLEFLTSVPEYREFALRTLAGQAILRKDNDAAEKWLISLRALFPEDYAVALAFGEVLHAQGRPAEALPLVEQAVRLQPERAQTYLLLAEVLNDAGRTQEMIEPLEACLKLDPDNAAARANLAFALRAAGRSEEAVREAEWCLARNPQQTSVRLILAGSLRDLGQLDSAWAHVERMRREAPDSLDAVLLEADILFYRGKGTDVYALLEPFAENHSDDRRFVSYMLRAATARKDRKLAGHWQQILQALLNESQ